MDNVILVAGTVVEQQLPDNSWVRIPRLVKLGAVGEQSTPKEKTCIEEDTKTYGSGMRDAPDKNLQGQYVPPQTDDGDYLLDRELQQKFIERARAEESMNVRVTYPDRERCQFLLKTLGYQVSDVTQEDWKLFDVNGKQNSRPIWSVADVMTGVSVSDLTAVPVGASFRLVATPIPADAYCKPGVTFSVDKPEILTVSGSGRVEGISPGTAIVTATLNGFDTTQEITVS